MQRREQAWAVERARLIDQILNLGGKPWTPAPADMTPPEAEPDPDLQEEAELTWEAALVEDELMV